MFVDRLNKKQQGILLALADQVIVADGKIADQEKTMLNTLRAQMIGDVQAESVTLDKLQSDFPSIATRSALLLELLGIAHADGDYHLNEKDFIGQIANQLSISDLTLADMESWVVRQFALVREAEQLMEG